MTRPPALRCRFGWSWKITRAFAMISAISKAAHGPRATLPQPIISASWPVAGEKNCAGLKNRQYRPDKAIVDDFENDINVRNPKLVKQGMDWLPEGGDRIAGRRVLLFDDRQPVSPQKCALSIHSRQGRRSVSRSTIRGSTRPFLTPANRRSGRCGRGPGRWSGSKASAASWAQWRLTPR